VGQGGGFLGLWARSGSARLAPRAGRGLRPEAHNPAWPDDPGRALTEQPEQAFQRPGGVEGPLGQPGRLLEVSQSPEMVEVGPKVGQELGFWLVAGQDVFEAV